MTFGWHGFALDHPDDWGPIALSGARREGYARIGSPDRMSLQVRWKTLGSAPDLQKFLRSYFARLERDAKRAGKTLHTETTPAGEGIEYHYRGATFGRGHVWLAQCDRAFVLEAASTQNDSLRSIARQAFATFRSNEPTDEWSVLGLRFRAPQGLEVERREFVAGRTRLWLRSKHVGIAAERWAFASELLRKNSMAEWACAVLGANRAEVTEEPLGLRIRWRGLPWSPPAEALVQHWKASNQFVILTGRTRRAEWRPTWDWLAE